MEEQITYLKAKKKSNKSDCNSKIINTINIIENQNEKEKEKIYANDSRISFKNLYIFKMIQNNINFEFGSGGSTNAAFFYNTLKIYSVESDVIWHNKLKSKNINVNYLTKDLKSRGNTGYPGSNTNVEDWKKYIQA